MMQIKHGYSSLSIIVHWIAAICVIALFATHEGDRSSAAYLFHASGGAIIGLFLLWRVWFRLRNGMTTKPDQFWIYNLASNIVIYGFLAAIVVVVLTGYFLPWSLGNPVDIYGWISIPSPIGASPALHEIVEEVHEISGQLFVPLLILHVLGAAKHAIIDKDGVTNRMFKSITGGR